MLSGNTVRKAIVSLRCFFMFITVCAFSFILILISNAVAYSSGSDEEYIERTFNESLSEIPRMAWIIIPDKVITDSKHEAIYLYADGNSILKAKYHKKFDRKEIEEIRNRNYVACDKEATYYGFSAGNGKIGSRDRVFYTSKSFSKKVTAGYQKNELSSIALNNLLSLKEIAGTGGVHNYFSVSLKDSDYTFSFHALYDKKTRGLFKSGIVLQSDQGNIIGKQFWEINEDNLCDGCGLPEYKSDNPENPQEDMILVFDIINLFSFPGFNYPVLLMDTSTIEGRAISFVTFDTSGNYQEYRDYEYVVNCILDSPY